MRSFSKTREVFNSTHIINPEIMGTIDKIGHQVDVFHLEQEPLARYIISESMRGINVRQQFNLRQMKVNQRSTPNLSEMDESVGWIEHNLHYHREANDVRISQTKAYSPAPTSKKPKPASNPRAWTCTKGVCQ